MEINFPIDYSQLTKRYYAISEVAELLSVSNSLLRHWESEIKQLKPSKTAKGDRKFTVEDIRLLEQIHHLVKVKGYTLDGAEKELDRLSKHNRQKEREIQKLQSAIERLESIRDRIGEL